MTAPRIPDLPLSRIKELLDYDPLTGLFTWKLITTPNQRKVGDVAGSRRKTGYVAIIVLGNTCLAHRLAWLYQTGEWPADQIDHISHVRDDNRFENLREDGNQSNHCNKTMLSNNTSGTTGVYWHRQMKKWSARLYCKGEHFHGGLFADKSDAIATRKQMEKDHGFHPNHGVNL